MDEASASFTSTVMPSHSRIDADLRGLINYFQAQNIRYKISHPVFLALKFHKCVKLFYKTQKVDSGDLL